MLTRARWARARHWSTVRPERSSTQSGIRRPSTAWGGRHDDRPDLKRLDRPEERPVIAIGRAHGQEEGASRLLPMGDRDHRPLEGHEAEPLFGNAEPRATGLAFATRVDDEAVDLREGDPRQEPLHPSIEPPDVEGPGDDRHVLACKALLEADRGRELGEIRDDAPLRDLPRRLGVAPEVPPLRSRRPGRSLVMPARGHGPAPPGILEFVAAFGDETLQPRLFGLAVRLFQRTKRHHERPMHGRRFLLAREFRGNDAMLEDRRDGASPRPAGLSVSSSTGWLSSPGRSGCESLDLSCSATPSPKLSRAASSAGCSRD